jgi:Protein of unknown function (DUF1553)
LPAAGSSDLATRLAKTPLGSAHDLAHRLAGFVAASERAWQTLKSSPAGAHTKELPEPALESIRKILYEPQGAFDPAPLTMADYDPAERAAIAALQGEVKGLQDSLPKLPEAMAVSESPGEDLRIHLRGSHLTLGELSPRRFPDVLSADRQPLRPAGSGRRELAAWLVDPRHPLTSRVMVNRVWLWHFGEGIVRSPDNFGALGERPTHPALLDWLSRRFVEQGWSLKQLHRLIMTSATYQMSVAENPRAAQIDPENRLWWRGNRRRLEAEALRDGILAACGELVDERGGSLLPTANRQYVTGTGSILPADLYTSRRRSIYLPVVRSALYEMFQAFDFADPSVLNGRRDSTTVAPQALFMMNSQLVSQATRKLAGRLVEGVAQDEVARIQLLYVTAYARPASTAEISRAQDFLARYTAAQVARSVAEPEARLSAWQALCRALLSANEFVYLE